MLLLEKMETGPAEILGYGGARGGSKSGGVRRVNVVRRLKYGKTDSLIFRRTYPELQQNHIIPLFREYPQLRQWYNASEKVLRFPNGSTTFFGSADDERGFARYQGGGYADIFLDEGEQIEQERIEWMRTVLRCTTNREIVPRLVITANPGDVSHGFLKRIFIDKDYLGNERPEDYDFIQAYGHDNVEWARNALAEDGLTAKDYYSWTDERRFDYFITRTQYGRNLNALPGRLRDAHLLGRWDVFVGQFFDNFRTDRHVVDGRLFRREPWWPVWISGDWGFADDGVIHWHTIDEKQKVTTYREMVFKATTPVEMAHMIAQATPDSERPVAFYYSKDAFAKRTSERSIAMEMGEVMHQYGLPAPQPADNERVSGWNLMYQMLDRDQWQMTDDCRELVATIPLMVRDVKKVEDIADHPRDHAPESARYGLVTHLRTPHVPTEEIIRRQITAKDPTQIHLQHLALQAKMRDQNRPLRYRRIR